VDQHLAGLPSSRTNFANWRSGKAMPSGIRRAALCRALGINESDLIPPYDWVPPPGAQQEDSRAFDLGDGWVRLDIHQDVPRSVAEKIMRLLRSPDALPRHGRALACALRPEMSAMICACLQLRG
jgi:transcriptional regulator with XRE-family HTH domain